MKRKINIRLTCLSVAVAIVTVICVMFVFYGLFERQVRADLRTDAAIIKACGIFGQTYKDEIAKSDTLILAEDKKKDDGVLSWLEDESEDKDAMRVTWMDASGNVLYDNGTDASLMENHAQRPEVAKAMESGEGESRRRSDTMGRTTYYYAVRLDDGSILRLSEDAGSIFSIFLSALPVMALIVAAIILVSAIIAHFLTGQLLAPINRMAQNIEDTSDVTVYEELIPFMDTIREQHENILSAAKSRQDFTANVSHELKTPLTAISGYAQLIENHMVDAKQETQFAEKIHENADRLLSLINDIIRLSELDNAQDHELAFEEIDLYETAQNRVELLRVAAAQKNITLTLKGESTPLRGNRHMIVELIDNLCQNAIQYNSENGKVNIYVGKEQGRPVLMVSDTGIGIPKDMQERIFERFFRVDKSRSRETGGTGLGLAIVKHIVELHDAEIELISEVGEGTTVRVMF